MVTGCCAQQTRMRVLWALLTPARLMTGASCTSTHPQWRCWVRCRTPTACWVLALGLSMLAVVVWQLYLRLKSKSQYMGQHRLLVCLVVGGH